MASSLSNNNNNNNNTRVIVHQIPQILALFDDGSIHRYDPPFPPLPSNPHFSNHIATKDLIIHSQTGVWARIFLPQTVGAASPAGQRVPIVLHFHGGSMCFGSPDSAISHQFCSRMAIRSHSIWISVAYRLSPEYRLPAAYDDCYGAISWIRCQAEDQGEVWLRDHGDFSRCFLAGESAGGTIVHFVAMRAAEKDWSPVQLRGMILMHPGFFRKIPRIKPGMDTLLTEQMLETSLKLSLPRGAEDTTGILHALVNPFHEDSQPKLGEVELPPAFVAVAGRDVLYDVGVEYYEALKEAGKEAELFISEGQSHCFHILKAEEEEEDREALEKRLISFMRRHF